MFSRIKKWRQQRKHDALVASLTRTQELAIAGVIAAPGSFKNASIEKLLTVCNGCGAAGSWFRPPANILGTVIRPACHVHDWNYNSGTCYQDKWESDLGMLDNGIRLIAKDSHKWYSLTILKSMIMACYFIAVFLFGGVAFWVGKNTI